ncbi:hypothetical protein ACIBSV_19495 [Embleya sp. NPDC050154]|uniref:hypothetical protein n=1 Tax=unclassified Embleya TaxID=2699296 RepID=UPI0037A1600B
MADEPAFVRADARPALVPSYAAVLRIPFVAPTITTAYLSADACATANSRTRVGAWVNTALNAGASTGTATTGLLIGRVPLPLIFTVAALPTLFAAATIVIAPASPES